MTCLNSSPHDIWSSICFLNSINLICYIVCATTLSFFCTSLWVQFHQKCIFAMSISGRASLMHSVRENRTKIHAVYKPSENAIEMETVAVSSYAIGQWIKLENKWMNWWIKPNFFIFLCPFRLNKFIVHYG